jgi:cell shape-determining protein MreD
MALVAVVWLLTVGGTRGFLAAGAIGLAGDLLAPGRVGLGMASFLLVGYALSRLRGRLPLEYLAVRVAIVFAAVTLTTLLAGYGRWPIGEPALPASMLVGRALGVGVYTAGVSLPVMMVLGWISPSKAFGLRRTSDI